MGDHFYIVKLINKRYMLELYKIIRFRLTSSVIRKIMHEIAFLGHLTRALEENIGRSALSESFKAKKL